jgi:hypothetical protein
MKTLMMTATAFAFALTLNVPAHAGIPLDGMYAMDFAGDAAVEKRRKKRIKGGSGCDDAHDVIEHPECR